MPVHTSPLEARLAGIVGPSLAGLGFDLVRVQVMGKDRITVQVMAERADQQPIGSDDLELIARQLSAVLDIEDPIKGAWTLECSSPGIDRPLTRPKDFARFAGHQARLECEPAIDGQRKFSGQLLGVDHDAVRLKLDTGAEAALPLASIRKAKLVLTEALIAATRPTAPN